MSDTDRRFMALAIGLARRGLGRVWPRPAVGCVIVADGRVVGRGVTAPGTGPHAEAAALAEAKERAKGAVAYVSLEPCAHFGRVPPCADALIAAGVARVVAPFADPFPEVAGRGFAKLRDAGIAVTTGVLEDEARRVTHGFLSRVLEGRPALALKLAASVDGRIATATGESQWITGPPARRAVHALRARHDAVLVGGGTARADDPALTVRGLGIAHQPVRILASRRLDLPLDSRLAQTAGDVPVWLLHGPDADLNRVDAWRQVGARPIETAIGPGGQLDPSAMLQALGNEGLTSVFCEGGGMLAGALLSARLVDELIQFSAGLALGAEGQPALGAMGIEALADAPRFRLQETRAIGADVVHHWIRAR